MKNVTKRIVLPIILEAAVMLLLPYLAVTFVKSDASMLVVFALFFAVDPLFSLAVGIYSGYGVAKLWFLPLLCALLFICGTWLFFSARESAFYIYAFAYLVIGYASMLITHFIFRKKRG